MAGGATDFNMLFYLYSLELFRVQATLEQATYGRFELRAVGMVELAERRNVLVLRLLLFRVPAQLCLSAHRLIFGKPVSRFHGNETK